MADRFYVNSSLALGDFALDGDEAHHLAVVCRLRPGATVHLFNGDGNDYHARILEAHKRQVTLTIDRIDAVSRELAAPLTVAVPLPKGDRAQILVEKLTEIGVTALVPLQTERSVVHPRETKLEKLERQVIEASKQCGRNVLMEIAPLVAWSDFRTQTHLGKCLLAHPGGIPLAQMAAFSGPVTVAVGPEGGFSDDEVQRAQTQGWQVVSLGASILRVETAAMVLASWLALRRDFVPV